MAKKPPKKTFYRMVPSKKVENPPLELHAFLEGMTFEWTNSSIEYKDLIMKCYDKESKIILQQLEKHVDLPATFFEEYIKGGLDSIANILEKKFEQVITFEKTSDRKSFDNILKNNISKFNWECIYFYSRFNLDFPYILWEKIKQRNPSCFKKYIPDFLRILDRIEYITPKTRNVYEEIAGYPNYATEFPSQYAQKRPEGYRVSESDREKFTSQEWRKKREEEESKYQKALSYRHFYIDPDGYFRNLYNYDEKTRIYMALGQRTCSQEEFKALFEDESENVIEALAGNPEAAMFPEFAKLFSRKYYENDMGIYTKLAANLEAPKFPQYRILFYVLFQPAGSGEYVHYCLRNIASNPNAYRFDEFRNLVYFKDKYIRMRVASNPSSLHFPEFQVLLNDYDEEVCNEAKVTYYMNVKGNK